MARLNVNRRELLGAGLASALVGASGVKAGDVERAGWARASHELPAVFERELMILATDGGGEPVTALTPEDFAVFEDGREKPLEVVLAEDNFPVRLGILIPYSRESVSRHVPHFRFVRELLLQASTYSHDVERLQPNDSVFLNLFGPDLNFLGQRELPIGSPNSFVDLLQLYCSAKALPELLQHVVCGEEAETKRIDLVQKSLAELRTRPLSVGALIVMSAVTAEQGRPPSGQLTTMLSKSTVPIYGVQVSEETAGFMNEVGTVRRFQAHNRQEWRDAQKRIFRDLRLGYRLRYLASAASGRVEVLVRGAGAVRIAGMHAAS